MVGDWAVEDTQNKAWQNLASDLRQALASKVVEGSGVALEVAVGVSAEGSEVIEAGLATEAVSAEIEVGMAEEAALATKAEVALEPGEDSQTVRRRPMRLVDRVDRVAVVMVAGMELDLQTVLDLTMATGAVAMGMVLVVIEIIVAAPAVRQGLTAVEINGAE